MLIPQTSHRLFITLLLLSALGACSTLEPQTTNTPPPSIPACAPCSPCPSCPDTTPPLSKTPRYELKQIVKPAEFADLPGWLDDDVRKAWPGFLKSCDAFLKKSATSPWKRVCDLAKKVDRDELSAVREFYETHFKPYRLFNPENQRHEGLITGYYEPLLRGSRERSGDFQTPALGIPDDLLTIDLSEVVPELKNFRLRGRIEGNKVVPYAPRRDIVGKAGYRPDKDKVLLWVNDPVELFFLQIQGSGRVQLPDGSQVRLGYADQNGHPYRSIGRVLIDRGDLKPEAASMQGIQTWGRQHPDRLEALLNANPSYVFFRELPAAAPEEGPPGALGVPLTPERSLAIDPRTTPLGAPLYLATTYPNSNKPLNQLMLGQDTGGAIRGIVRADFFWGFGRSAGEQAGKMKQTGQLWVLLPEEAAP